MGQRTRHDFLFGPQLENGVGRDKNSVLLSEKHTKAWLTGELEKAVSPSGGAFAAGASSADTTDAISFKGNPLFDVDVGDAHDHEHDHEAVSSSGGAFAAGVLSAGTPATMPTTSGLAYAVDIAGDPAVEDGDDVDETLQDDHHKKRHEHQESEVDGASAAGVSPAGTSTQAPVPVLAVLAHGTNPAAVPSVTASASQHRTQLPVVAYGANAFPTTSTLLLPVKVEYIP